MDTELKNNCDLLVKNRKILSDAFSFDSSYMTYASALLFMGEHLEVNKDYAKQCNDIIKKNTGMFSEFRGNVKQPVICKMMLSGNPEAYFQKINKALEVLRKIKWTGDEYRILAAIVICDHAEEDQFEMYVERTMTLYKRMKEEHSILTGTEDIPFAALLAVSDLDIDKLLVDMEETFKILKTKFHDGNAVQSLSHVLCLDEAPAEVKCDRVMKIFDELKAIKHKYSTGLGLASLGTLGMLDMSEKQIADCIAETDTYLKSQKGFGDLALGATERRMFASQIVLETYGNKNSTAGSVVLTSMLALTIAIEICMLICILSCVTTTTTVN